MAKLGDITRRVKAMLATAANPSSTPGEVSTAMDMATRLMEKYNLEREDVEKIDDSDTFDLSKMEFDRVIVTGKSSKSYCWETCLANFICGFIVGANYYTSKQTAIPHVPVRGGFKQVSVKIFYGPTDDVQLAAELYRQLHETAYSYAMQMYGGWCKGSGGSFCQGFVKGLEDAHGESLEKTEEPLTTALTIIDLSQQITVASKGWLSTEHDIKLRSYRLGGVGRPDANAFNNGREVGAAQSMNTSKRIG